MTRRTSYASLFLLLILSLPFTVWAKNIEHEAVRFVEDSSAMAQIAVWNDPAISPARYAVQQAVSWYKKQISPVPSPADTRPQPNEFVLVFLGQTPDEIWTLEGGLLNDAEANYFFNFVRTKKDGTRHKKAIIPPLIVEEEAMQPEKLEKKLLGNLWRLTSKHGERQTQLMPANILFDLRDWEAKMAASSCSVRAKIADKTLCYSVTHTTSMCWYFYEWTAKHIKK